MDPSQAKKYSYVEIDRIAIQLLKKTFDDVISPPIDIDIVAESLENFNTIRLLPNLQKCYSVDACLYYLPNGQCDIFIDSEVDSFKRERSVFSVAHELGHFVLHNQIFKNCKNIEDIVMLNENIKSKYIQIEREANYFAGSILIPHTTIFSDSEKIYNGIMRGLAPDVHEPTFDIVFPKMISTLAARYMVSTQAMSIRIEQLKIDKPIKQSLESRLDIIMWD